MRLEVNLQKQQIVSSIDNQALQVEKEYLHLGDNIRVGNDNQTTEMSTRI